VWWEAPTRWVVYLDTERALVRCRTRSGLRGAWRHVGIVPRGDLSKVLAASEGRARGSLSVLVGSSLCRFETLHQVERVWRSSDLVALARSRLEQRIHAEGSTVRVATEAIWNSSAVACAISAELFAQIESAAASLGLTLVSVRPWIGELFRAISGQVKSAQALALFELDAVTLAIGQSGTPSIQTLPARDEASANECLRLLAASSAVDASSIHRFRLTHGIKQGRPRMRDAFADLVVPIEA